MDNMTIIGIAIIVIVIVAGGVYILIRNNSPSSSSTTTVVQAQTNTTSIVTVKPTTTNQAPTVILETNVTIGSYLANGTGFTLYTFSYDTPNSGASVCYASCAANWPPLSAANLVLAPGLSASNFNTITRTDGSLQLTYHGYPLYTFIGDHASGQINGNGQNGFNVAIAQSP